MSDHAYKRCRLLSPPDRERRQGPNTILPEARIKDTAISLLGLVNRSPVYIVPGRDGTFTYKDDYRTFQFYNDVHEADNLAPDLRDNMLAHYDFDRPGRAVYKFVAPCGVRVSDPVLSVSLKMILIKTRRSDSAVTVSVGRDGETYRELDLLTHEDFLTPDGELPPPNNENKYFLDKTYPLGERLAPGDALYVKIEFAAVKTNGAAGLEMLRLDAKAEASEQAADPALEYFENIARNTPLTPWDKGAKLINSNALYAFSLNDVRNHTGPDSPWNSVSDHEAFLDAAPDVKPVFTLDYADGAPAFAFYDPALTNPFAALGRRPARLRLGAPLPFAPKAVKLEGALDRPALKLGEYRLDIPVTAPGGASAILNADGRGELRLTPTFSNEDAVKAALPIRSGLRKNPGEDCLSCGQDAPCFATIPVSSAFPITKLRIQAYPRVFADAKGKNRLVTSFSLDGEHFTPLDELKSSRSGLWEGLMVRRVSTVAFPTPIRKVFVRFDLSGQGAQLWSRDHERMRIEADLDTSKFVLPVLDADAFTASASPAPSGPGLLLLPETQRFYETLKDDY